MKNQFVADVNDYFKYGLLRALARQFVDAPLGVWWMLTKDDAGGHGDKRGYLDDPHSYGACDSELFASLKEIAAPSNRNVLAVERSNVIPGAHYWPHSGDTRQTADTMAKASHDVLDDPAQRATDFNRLLAYFDSCPVVFIDPDNGVETKTTARSERHVRWTELQALFRAGKSLVVYQHKQNGKSLDDLLPTLAERWRSSLGIDAFGIACGTGPKKGQVGFLMIPQPDVATSFVRAAETFLKDYKSFAKRVPLILQPRHPLFFRGASMNIHDRITLEPGKRGGKPCIRHMRITVYDVLGWLAAGMTQQEIIDDYPELEIEDIQACLAFAADRERRMVRIAA